MKFGLDVPTTGVYADVRAQAQLAAEAEAAGWDGFFMRGADGSHVMSFKRVLPMSLLIAARILL